MTVYDKHWHKSKFIQIFYHIHCKYCKFIQIFYHIHCKYSDRQVKPNRVNSYQPAPEGYAWSALTPLAIVFPPNKAKESVNKLCKGR